MDEILKMVNSVTQIGNSLLQTDISKTAGTMVKIQMASAEYDIVSSADSKKIDYLKAKGLITSEQVKAIKGEAI